MKREKIFRLRNLSFPVSFFVLLLFFLTTGCGNPNATAPSNDKGQLVARVYNYKLYKSDLAELVPKGSTADDSLRIVKSYINNWVREMVLVKKAEDNLNAQQKNVQKQLEAYRNSLIIYAYEKELVRQKLDTNVSEAEIEKYYKEHPENFQLKDNIIKVRYVKASKKAPNVAKLKTLYKSDKPQDLKDLENWCKQFAENYYLDDNSWLLFDDLLKEIPIQTYNKELFLENNRFVEVADSSYQYFVNILGFKVKDGVSPLAFEKDNIRKIILNKRKLDLIDKAKDDLFSSAIENKDIEILTK
jgi:hypothetical protein